MRANGINHNHSDIRAVILIIVFTVLLFGGCDLFTPFDLEQIVYDNPVDPEAGDAYIGYPSVDNPGDVVPVSPADGKSVSYAVFTCTPCPSAGRYAIQIAASENGFDTPLYSADSFTANIISLSDIDLPAQGYYWRVRACGEDGGWGDWSSAVRFTAAGSTGAGLDPANSGITIDTTPALSWTSLEGAASYELQLAVDSQDFSAVEALHLTSPAYIVPPEDIFSFGQTVYWRIRPISTDGTAGFWSATWSFAVSFDVTFSGMSPADSGSTADTTPLLSWDSINGAAKYRLQFAVGAAADFSGATVYETADETAEFQVPGGEAFLTGDLVHWRLRVLNSDDVEGDWSPSWSFNIDWNPVFSGISPHNDCYTFDTTPLLDWDDISGADSYELQIDDNSGFSSPSEPASSISEYQMAALSAGDSCYWHIRPVNVNGFPGPWSSTYQFLIVEAGDQKSETAGAVSFNMRAVAGGSYYVGSLTGTQNYAGSANVSLSRGFWIGETEVTYALWDEVYDWATDSARGADIYSFSHAGLCGSDVADTRNPVTTVNWRDAMQWCNALSERTGLTPVYYSDAAFTSPIRTVDDIPGYDFTQGDMDNPYIDWTADGYRLPTAAEWEIAARGGSPALGAGTYGSTYSGSDTRHDVAWSQQTSGGDTVIVGQLAANELGIYDMSGNVWEWCFDYFDYHNDVYPSTLTSTYGSPYGAPANADIEGRIPRGGGFKDSYDDQFYVHSRPLYQGAYYESNDFGLRVLKNAD